MKQTVVMLAKAPVPGQVKTRLAASIGADRAAALHAAFIADLAAMVGELDLGAVFAWAGDEEHAGFAPVRDAGFEFVPQATGDLGARMEAAIRQQAATSEFVLVIGSDSPTLQASHIHEAFERLRTHNVVIGPSFDGGYYLLGVQSRWFLDHRGEGIHPLFADIAWSTGDVLGQTLSRCQALGALCDLTPFWYDVDTLEDLNLLRTHLLQHLRASGLDVAPHTAILLSDTLNS